MSRLMMKYTAAAALASVILFSEFIWFPMEQTSAKADSRSQDKILEQLSVISSTVQGYAAWKHGHLHFLWNGYNVKEEPVAELYEIIPEKSSGSSKTSESSETASAGYVVISKQSASKLLEFGNHLPESWLRTNSKAGRHYYLGPGGWFVNSTNHQDPAEHADSGDQISFETLQANWLGESAQQEDLKPTFDADTLIPEISASPHSDLSAPLHAVFSKVSTPDFEPLEGLGIAVESLNSPSTQAVVLKEGGWAVENFSTSNYFVVHAVKGLLTLSKSTEQNKTKEGAQAALSHRYLQFQNVFLPEASFYANADFPFVWVSAKPGAM